MTQMKLVREEVSAAGLGAKLFWYHDRGYFEEFLGHKKGFKDGSAVKLNYFSRSEGSSNRPHPS